MFGFYLSGIPGFAIGYMLARVDYGDKITPKLILKAISVGFAWPVLFVWTTYKIVKDWRK